MVRHPLDQAKAEHTPALEAVAVPIEEFTLPASSVDLVVSSYALHHLRDPDKARLVAAAAGWLRPGGFADITAETMVAEAGLVTGRRPVLLAAQPPA